MIPITPQPEPADFADRVGNPGAIFLAQNSRPANWPKKEYWRRIIPDLHQAYRGICAYCVEWIPLTTSTPHVDHFKPKERYPEDAYKWSNYRLASPRFNSRKSTHEDVLDPFILSPDWFMIDFPSLQLKEGSALSSSQINQVKATINRLKLNDETCINSRKRWIRDYCQGKIIFDFLKDNAPFIAYELERQDLVDRIKQMMVF